MINLDLSKVLPTRAYELLSGFLPGLFFVFSVVLANPALAGRFSTNSEPGLTLGRYGVIATVLFLAFVIGNGFILLDSVIQYVFYYVYAFKMFAWRKVCQWPLRQLTHWLGTRPRWQRPWVGRLHVRVSTIADVGFQDWRKVQQCWEVLAKRLLVAKYGIQLSDFEHLEPLYSSLGTLTPEEFRGSMFLIACHATGWAGLAASRIAPALRNWAYIGFCLFLIFNGFLHAYYVVKRKVDPRVAGTLTIRALLRELDKLDKANPPPEEQ